MFLKRTATCGELTGSDIGRKVVLNGWVGSMRDHGGLVFVDLRDRRGITQVVFNPERHAESHGIAEQIRPEWVISVKGKVEQRMYKKMQ